MTSMYESAVTTLRVLSLSACTHHSEAVESCIESHPVSIQLYINQSACAQAGSTPGSFHFICEERDVMQTS